MVDNHQSKCMPEAKPPRGLLRREEALERRLADLESGLIGLQTEYESASRQLAELRSFARRLADWGLNPADTGTWTGVCKALGWPASGVNAHRTVRRGDSVLHILLHRCAFPSYCSLDGVSYMD